MFVSGKNAARAPCSLCLRPSLRQPDLALSMVQPPLDPPQLAIRRVQEVARATCRVEHDVVHELVLKPSHRVMSLSSIDPLVPRVDDRRLDDLLDVHLVRVMRTERMLSLAPEGSLQQRSEDVRLHLAPVVLAGEAQHQQILLVQVHLGGLLEQSAVHVPGLRIQAARRASALAVEPGEELTEIVGARPLRRLDELVHDPREEVAFELTEVLGEQASDGLQQEVAANVGGRSQPVAQLVIEPGHQAHGLPRHGLLRCHEDGLAIGEEHQRVHPVGQIDEIEPRAWLGRIGAGLPDLEAPKRAQDDEAGCGHVVSGVGRVAPVRQCLLAVRLEPPGLARTLHLHDAAAWPDEVEELPLLSILEECADPLAIGSVAVEQLVEERLRFGAFAALVEAPLPREVDESSLDLLARHPRGSRFVRRLAEATSR